MRFRSLNGRLAIAIAAVALGTAGCGSDDETAKPDAPASSSESTIAKQDNPALQKLAEAAKGEGKLNLNWGFSQSDLGPLVDAFNGEYPDIKVKVTASQDQPANTAKLIQEVKAKRPSSTDAFVAVPELLWQAGPKRADALEAVDWAEFAPWTKGLEDADGAALSVFDQIPGFTYNTGEFKENELPKTAKEVAALKQPIASTPYAAQFNALGTEDALGQAGVLEYLKGFKPAGLIGCGDLTRIASGEFAALWIGCGKNISDIFAAQGAPLETSVIEDAAVTYPWYMAVPKNSEHPNAAKLWIAWLATPEAQKLLFKREFADNKRIKGSRTAEQLAEFEAKGAKFTVADYGFVEKNPKLFDREFAGAMIGALTKK